MTHFEQFGIYYESSIIFFSCDYLALFTEKTLSPTAMVTVSNKLDLQRQGFNSRVSVLCPWPQLSSNPLLGYRGFAANPGVRRQASFLLFLFILRHVGHSGSL